MTIVVSLGDKAAGQKIEPTGNKPEVFVEIDPITFGFHGYGVHLRIKPKNSTHMLAGLGTYAMDMPAALVNFDKANADKGWGVRLNHGYSLFIEDYLTKVNKRWFIGAQAGIQQFKIKKDNAVGNSKYSNLLLMAYGGYTFRPFKFNLYIKPWAGLGYTTKLSGSNALGDRTYHIAPITLFATLHIGYTF